MSAKKRPAKKAVSNPLVRITVKNGRHKLPFILQRPPYPEVGDVLAAEDGSEWEVVTVTKVKGPVVLTRRAKLVKG